ncbi:MAG: hypothetical protein RR107_04455, partial [Clostridia bacterium]
QETKPLDDAFVKAVDAVSEKSIEKPLEKPTKFEAKSADDKKSEAKIAEYKLVDAAIKIES